MNRRTLIFLTCLLIGFSVTAQEKVFDKPQKEFAQIDLGVSGTTMLNECFMGYAFEVKLSPANKFFSGVAYSKSGKNMSHDFGYQVNTPVVNYYDVSWVNQYRVFQGKRLRINLSFNNGVAFIRLGDDQVRQIVSDPFYGSSSMPKKVLLDVHYLVEPGIDFQLPLMGSENNIKLYLTGKLKYRCLVGKGSLGDNYNLNNIYASIGISYMVYHP